MTEQEHIDIGIDFTKTDKKKNETTLDVSPFSELVTVTRTCKCGVTFECGIPKMFQNSGPRYCDPCAIKKSAEIDEMRRFDAVPEMIINSGIPSAYQVWNDAKAKETGSDQLLPWIEARLEQNVWIGGTNGIGKTHTLMHAAFRMIKNHALPCRAIRCSSWFRNQSTLRAGDWKARAEATTEFNKAAKTRLLILDDLGKEKMTEVKAELLYDLIDIRERDGLKLWITSNKGGKQLRRRLNGNGDHDHGDAVLARLIRMIPKANIIGSKEDDRRED